MSYTSPHAAVQPHAYDPVTHRLSINYNYNSYRVKVAGATIENIYFGSEAKYNVFTSATITLYAVEDFNLGERGNITVASQRPVPRGSSVTLRYSPDQTTWVEV